MCMRLGVAFIMSLAGPTSRASFNLLHKAYSSIADARLASTESNAVPSAKQRGQPVAMFANFAKVRATGIKALLNKITSWKDSPQTDPIEVAFDLSGPDNAARKVRESRSTI